MFDDPKSFSSKIISIIINEMDDRGAVEFYRVRLVMGPQAWEHRYISEDTRRQGMKRFVNKLVKGREFFRPFAPGT